MADDSPAGGDGPAGAGDGVGRMARHADLLRPGTGHPGAMGLCEGTLRPFRRRPVQGGRIRSPAAQRGGSAKSIQGAFRHTQSRTFRPWIGWKRALQSQRGAYLDLGGDLAHRKRHCGRHPRDAAGMRAVGCAGDGFQPVHNLLDPLAHHVRGRSGLQGRAQRKAARLGR